MSAWFTADWHVGNHRKFGGEKVSGLNHRCRLILRSVSELVTYLNGVAATSLFILGDVFDTADPDPQIIAALRAELAKFHGQVYAMVGNHDMVSTQKGDHALGPLALPGKITVVDKPETVFTGGRDTHIHLLPYRPGRAVDTLNEWLEDFHPVVANNILGIHAGLHAGEVKPWLAESSSAININDFEVICRRKRITKVYAGDWHNYAFYGNDILSFTQVSALVPTGFDNPGTDGYGLVHCLDGASYKQPGVRFVNSLSEVSKGAFYVKVKSLPEAIAKVKSELDSLKQVLGYEITVDNTESIAVAASAASAVRQASSIDTAIENFVKTMALDKRVDQAKLLARVREYVK